MESTVLKFIRSLVLLLAILVFHSCKPVKALVNNQFPPLSITDQQYVSVERNLAGIESFNPHVGVHIDKGILLEYLPPEIKKAALAVENEDIIVNGFEPKLSFDKQGIFIDADFSIAIPEYHAAIKGKLVGATSVSTGTDSLYFHSALRSVKINSIKFTKKPSLTNRVLANLIAPILKNYIENINGEILKKPTVIYAGWGEAYEVELKELFKGQDIEIIADPLAVSRYVKKSSVRIKSDGVAAMVELAKTQSELDSLLPLGATTRSEAELEKLFRIYDGKFDKLWLDVFEPIGEASVMVNVSKAEIASILNDALSKPITLRQDFAIPKTEFNEKLELEKKDIDCQKVRTSFRYPDFNGPSCNWSCSRWDPVCHSTRAACRVRREAQRVVWQAARETARIAHQIENEAKVAACNVQREVTGFLALGRFKGDIMASGKAGVNFKYFHFNEALSEISFGYSGGVDAKLKSDLELRPVDLGHVFFCFSNYSKKVSSDIKVNIPQAVSKIDVTARRDGNNLLLDIKPEKVAYDASISPSPLHALLIDPQFAAQCPISTLVGLISSGTALGKFLGFVKLAPEQELLLLGKVKGSYGIDAIQIPFKPIEFKINGERKESQLYWNSKSIQFAYHGLPAAEPIFAKK